MIRDLQNEKRNHPHSLASEVESVRIVIISFRNITKNILIQKGRALEKVLYGWYEVTANVVICEKFRVKWNFSVLSSSKSCWIMKFENGI